MLQAGASSSLGQSLKKKVMQTKTTMVTKTLTEQKKEKKVYSLPGQRHDPPEDVRAAIFKPPTFHSISFNDQPPILTASIVVAVLSLYFSCKRHQSRRLARVYLRI